MDAACSDEPKPTFAIVGDSVTRLASCSSEREPMRCNPAPESTSAIQDALKDRYRVIVEAENGQRIDQMLDVLAHELESKPAVVAANLGTNDTIQAYPRWRESFDQLVAMMLPYPCVILTTISLAAENYDRTGAQIARQINAAIREAEAANPNIRVVDWSSAVEQHGFGFVADGVHPVIPGQRWLGEQYRAAADSC